MGDSAWNRLMSLCSRRSGSAIGIDLGTSTLRAAQLDREGELVRWVAGAQLDVDAASTKSTGATGSLSGATGNIATGNISGLAGQLRELIGSGAFKGRRVVLGLPAWATMLLHVRVPLLQGAALKAAVETEAATKLAASSAVHAQTKMVYRFSIAGQVTGGRGNDKATGTSDAKLEAVVMACPLEIVEAILSAAASAKLDVVDMTVPYRAVLALAGQFGRRKEDRESNAMYVDVGCDSTRVMIARTLAGGQVMFARNIELGAKTLLEAATKAAGGRNEEAVRLWNEYDAAVQDEAPAEHGSRTGVGAQLPDEASSFALLPPTTKAAGASPPPLPGAVENNRGNPASTALSTHLQRLGSELDMCRRYFESLPLSGGSGVERLVFLGGLARRRSVSAVVGQQLQLPTVVADPLSRVAKPPEGGMDVIDGDGPHPQWMVAAGLSLLDPELAVRVSKETQAAKEAA